MELSTVKSTPAQQSIGKTTKGKAYYRADDCIMEDGTVNVRVFKIGSERVKPGDQLRVEFSDQFGASGWVDLPRPRSQGSDDTAKILQFIYDDIQLIKANLGIEKENKSKWDEARDKFSNEDIPEWVDDAEGKSNGVY